MMLLRIISVLVLFGGTNASYGELDVISEPSLTDRLRKDVIKRIEELWNETGTPEWQYLAKKTGGLDGELVVEFTKLSEEIETSRVPMTPDSTTVPSWIHAFLSKEMSNINEIWITFRASQAGPDPAVNSKLWKKVAEMALNDSTGNSSAYNSLKKLQTIIWDNDKEHKNVFQIVNEESDYHFCKSDTSRQQSLYNLYATLQISQLKAYVMVQFSWLLLQMYDKGNFAKEAKSMRLAYIKRMAQQAQQVMESMKEVDNTLWKCDPQVHQDNRTYTQLTKVLQGFLVNEVDLGKEDTCQENCPFYEFTKQYHCHKDNFCQKQPRCKGDVVGCQFVDSDMWVCQAPHNSGRRYDWIEYENGRILGSKKSCQRPVTKVDSWWKYLVWHCSFCYCYCDDPKDPKSERYFNLKEVISDKRNNRVVTGIKFVKKNRIVHLQIQEGELLPLGGINETTVRWKPIDPYNIYDDNITVGIDFYRITWSSRSLDLDDLKVPKDSIVTGVKLRRVGSHLNLEIQASKFNFTDGKLLQNGNKSTWISNDKSDQSPDSPRSKLNLPKPDIPTKREIGPSVPDSKPEQYVEFGPSDLDSDAGQTTVPFLDIQEVASRPPVPLSGIGIYHKGNNFSGGFIAPRIFTYDFSKHIVEHFPELADDQS